MLEDTGIAACRQRIVAEPGGGDVVELIGATAMIASKLLPKRIRRVLTAHVESTGAEKGILKKPLLVERPEIEVDKNLGAM